MSDFPCYVDGTPCGKIKNGVCGFEDNIHKGDVDRLVRYAIESSDSFIENLLKLNPDCPVVKRAQYRFGKN